MNFMWSLISSWETYYIAMVNLFSLSSQRIYKNFSSDLSPASSHSLWTNFYPVLPRKRKIPEGSFCIPSVKYTSLHIPELYCFIFIFFKLQNLSILQSDARHSTWALDLIASHFSTTFAFRNFKFLFTPFSSLFSNFHSKINGLHQLLTCLILSQWKQNKQSFTDLSSPLYS